MSFNFKIPRLLRSDSYFDLVVGFDLDGFRWSTNPARRGPYALCLKGIAADEARFSRSVRERLFLSACARLERSNARGADLVVVPSRYSAGVARERYRIAEASLRVVPEPVDLRPWKELRKASNELTTLRVNRRPTILSVARQYPRKDTQTLLRAMPAVLEAHPTALLIVIGGGPELSRLAALAKQLDIADSVQLRGAVRSNDEVREAFFDAQVFCLPSLQEGFGIAFVEAMAAGLPIVAARSSAVPEIVDHARTGLLVGPGNVDELAGALSRLLADPDERRRLGEAGLESAERFDLDTVGRRFLDAVRPILPGRQGR